MFGQKLDMEVVQDFIMWPDVGSLDQGWLSPILFGVGTEVSVYHTLNLSLD